MAALRPRYRGFGGKVGAAAGAMARGRGECAVFGNDVWENVGFGEIRCVGLNGWRVWGGVVQLGS